jgi:hypothetical protein
MAAHINGSCTGVPGSVPVACGPRPSDDRSPAINAVTTFGFGADVVVGVTNAVGTTEDAGADSVVAVDTLDVPWTGGAADALGAGAALPPGVDDEDVDATDDFALSAGG